MADSVEVRFTTDKAGVDRLLHSTTGPYAQWLARIGNRAVNAAKPRANVLTGLMRSSIDFTIEMDGDEVVGILAAHTGYARFIHDGTIYIEGNPFLTDAVRDVFP